MSWLSRIFESPPEAEGVSLIKLRSSRFRHLLRSYGKFLDLIADAAEKQGGDYILDKQYIVSMAEILFNLADAVVFDLNVMTNQRYGSLYDLMERFHMEVKKIITSWNEHSNRQREAGKPPDRRTGPRAPIHEDKLVEAIARYPTLYGQKGQVACRGVAAGVVFNLATERDPGLFPNGAILVAPEVKPEAELLRVIRKAAAILTDIGKPVSQMASVARELRIPTIVGLKDVSERLTTGTLVTVDADENTVYLGQFQELLDYYREEHLGPEEEMEYVLLRNLRRTVFQLTIGEGGSLGPPINDCKSLYDIVHLGQELAGDALVELITGRRDVKKTSIEVDAGFAATLRAIFLNGAPASGLLPMRPEIRSINCLPLRTFAAGVSAFYRELGPAPPPFTVGTTMAIVNDEHANIIVIQPEGFDMIDSYMSESKESNYIYCRLTSGVHEPHLTGGRVGVAGEILSRLDFTTARTGKGVSAWISSLPREDLEERLLGVGHLAGYLQEMDAVGWRDINVEERVENFMLHFA